MDPNFPALPCPAHYFIAGLPPPQVIFPLGSKSKKHKYMSGSYIMTSEHEMTKMTSFDATMTTLRSMFVSFKYHIYIGETCSFKTPL